MDAGKYCNGETNCSDGSDEEKCDCTGYLTLARSSALCDGERNCIDKSDEQWKFCYTSTDCSNNQRMFHCHK